MPGRERIRNQDDLRWLADRNMLEASKVCALWHPEGEVETRDDLQLVASGTRFPAGVFNCAQAFAAPIDSKRARGWLEHAQRFYGARARGFSVYTRKDRDEVLAAACAALDMQAVDGSPGMVLEREVAEPPGPDGMRIERVFDAAGLADFVTVAAPAYEMMSLPEGVTQGLFADARRVLLPDLACHVAYLDGVPAATVLTLASHGIAGLYWVATRPNLQRRGLAEAITRHACNRAFEAGAACVILQASRFGEPVYRRIGFREITRYPWFFMTHKQLVAAGHASPG